MRRGELFWLQVLVKVSQMESNTRIMLLRFSLAIIPPYGLMLRCFLLLVYGLIFKILVKSELYDKNEDVLEELSNHGV